MAPLKHWVARGRLRFPPSSTPAPGFQRLFRPLPRCRLTSGCCRTGLTCPAEMLLFPKPCYRVQSLTLPEAGWVGGRLQAAGAGNRPCYKVAEQQTLSSGHLPRCSRYTQRSSGSRPFPAFPLRPPTTADSALAAPRPVPLISEDCGSNLEPAWVAPGDERMLGSGGRPG